MTDYEVRLKKPVKDEFMTRLKVEQGYNLWGLEITWKEKIVFLKNVSEFHDVPGIRKAFVANAKFILAMLAEIHGTDGKLYKGDNVIDAYYGSDEPSLADDMWNSVRRWASIAFK